MRTLSICVSIFTFSMGVFRCIGSIAFRMSSITKSFSIYTFRMSPSPTGFSILTLCMSSGTSGLRALSLTMGAMAISFGFMTF